MLFVADNNSCSKMLGKKKIVGYVATGPEWADRQKGVLEIKWLIDDLSEGRGTGVAIL